MGQLDHKVAIVTGASRGIGKAIAETFAREGASVVICGRKQDTLNAVAEEFKALSGKVVPTACHVGRPEELQKLVASANEQFGRIDIVVNNAATNIAQGPAIEMDEGQFDKMIDLNLKSVFRMCKLVVPGMMQRGSGSIINIASIAGLFPQFHGMLYSLTKAALIMMTKSLAQELGPSGVRVNAIAPGLIQTHLSEYYWKDEDRWSQMLKVQPIKHLGQPAEIAGVALMLASDAGSYMTGQTIVVDGGRTLSSM
ncbi:MAG TPA: SDR family oxidoreductase [Bryobacteraceae bacterium]|nr:SDR family oxidoreductase [Bryobacteraceae bacterium]